MNRLSNSILAVFGFIVLTGLACAPNEKQALLLKRCEKLSANPDAAAFASNMNRIRKDQHLSSGRMQNMIAASMFSNSARLFGEGRYEQAGVLYRYLVHHYKKHVMYSAAVFLSGYCDSADASSMVVSVQKWMNSNGNISQRAREYVLTALYSEAGKMFIDRKFIMAAGLYGYYADLAPASEDGPPSRFMQGYCLEKAGKTALAIKAYEQAAKFEKFIALRARYRVDRLRTRARKGK